MSKRKWSDEDDKILLGLVKDLGQSQDAWRKIAEIFPQRNAKQCRERYSFHLSPVLDKGPWSLEEEKALFQIQAVVGNQWTDISHYLPGRSEASVKNRYYSALRRVERAHGVTAAQAAGMLQAHAQANMTEADAQAVAAIAKALRGHSAEDENCKSDVDAVKSGPFGLEMGATEGHGSPLPQQPGTRTKTRLDTAESLAVSERVPSSSSSPPPSSAVYGMQRRLQFEDAVIGVPLRSSSFPSMSAITKPRHVRAGKMGRERESNEHTGSSTAVGSAPEPRAKRQRRLLDAADPDASIGRNASFDAASTLVAGPGGTLGNHRQVDSHAHAAAESAALALSNTTTASRSFARKNRADTVSPAGVRREPSWPKNSASGRHGVTLDYVDMEGAGHHGSWAQATKSDGASLMITYPFPAGISTPGGGANGKASVRFMGQLVGGNPFPGLHGLDSVLSRHSMASQVGMLGMPGQAGFGPSTGSMGGEGAGAGAFTARFQSGVSDTSYGIGFGLGMTLGALEAARRGPRLVPSTAAPQSRPSVQAGQALNLGAPFSSALPTSQPSPGLDVSNPDSY